VKTNEKRHSPWMAPIFHGSFIVFSYCHPIKITNMKLP